MTVTVTAPGMRSILGSCPAPWGAQTRFPSAPGCSWRPSTRCVDPTCWSSPGPLLDLCWILLPAAVVRFRHASVVVVRALVMFWHHDYGQTLARAPYALMGPIQVCRQTTGLDQRPECDHAAGDRCGNLADPGHRSR